MSDSTGSVDRGRQFTAAETQIAIRVQLQRKVEEALEFGFCPLGVGSHCGASSWKQHVPQEWLWDWLEGGTNEEMC